MALWRELKRRAHHVIGPVLGFLAVGYFAYHVTHGDRSLLAWRQLAHEIAEAERILRQVSAEQMTLERRVRLLRPDSLDPDMLEERARAVLNFAREDEMVVLSGGRRGR
jgi:cell division protein FtsB